MEVLSKLRVESALAKRWGEECLRQKDHFMQEPNVHGWW